MNSGVQPELASAWSAPWNRLKRDWIGMTSLYVVAFYFLLIVAATFGFAGGDWSRH